MKLLKTYLYGLATGIVVFAFAVFWMFFLLTTAAQEEENRMARQLANDKAFIRKVPALREKLRTDDCVISDGRMVCQYTDRRGILQRVEISE